MDESTPGIKCDRCGVSARVSISNKDLFLAGIPNAEMLDAEYAAAKTKVMKSVQAERGDIPISRDAVIEEILREKHAELESRAAEEEAYQADKAKREAEEALKQETQSKTLLKIIEKAPMAL